jgi:hypothetical protein
MVARVHPYADPNDYPYCDLERTGDDGDSGGTNAYAYPVPYGHAYAQ